MTDSQPSSSLWPQDSRRCRDHSEPNRTRQRRRTQSVAAPQFQRSQSTARTIREQPPLPQKSVSVAAAAGAASADVSAQQAAFDGSFGNRHGSFPPVQRQQTTLPPFNDRPAAQALAGNSIEARLVPSGSASSRIGSKRGFVAELFSGSAAAAAISSGCVPKSASLPLATALRAAASCSLMVRPAVALSLPQPCCSAFNR